MTDDRNRRKNGARESAKDGRAVPFGRLSRFARFGGMATQVAGNMFFDGASQLLSGKRPSVSDLLMTPANALKVTHQLANMRGAAMKIGQMLSMDSGDFLPREFADILAQLRSDGQHMPRKQLDAMLLAGWGANWRDQFAQFSPHPIAAASIGQVHSAQTWDGYDIAIKVQYPGVKDSIDSDINNVATLLRMTGLLPDTMDIKPLLEEAKRQLHEEADYQREAKYLQRFGKLLDGDDNFMVPQYYPKFSTDKILAMSYIDGVEIDDMTRASQNDRDKIAFMLIDLLLRELFEFHLMQTDPNFANYRFNIESKSLVLLDFGASREISKKTSNMYRKLMAAVLSGNSQSGFDAATEMGFIAKDMPDHYRDTILDMLDMAMQPLQYDGAFDFGNNDISASLRDKGMAMAMDKKMWHLPPVDTIFIQRKFSGIFMMASRLKAKVNVRALMQHYIL